MTHVYRSEFYVSTLNKIEQRLSVIDANALSGNNVRELMSETADEIATKWKSSTAGEYPRAHMEADFRAMGRAFRVAGRDDQLNSTAKKLVGAFLNNDPCDDKRFPGLPQLVGQISELARRTPTVWVPPSP